ncbi:MAG: hypothetical protein WCP82_05390 [Alphaproteobacteria bacterium]
MSGQVVALTEQRPSYLQEVRGLNSGKRTLGFAVSLLGAMLLIWGRMRVDSPPMAIPSGLVLIATGWALFIYVIVMRTRYVRTHPFDPKR